MQFHILSFEGPDAYSRAGGIATRVTGLAQSLAASGFESHLWFVGDPDAPGHEQVGGVSLHRWCRALAGEYRTGVYDGEFAKCDEYAHSLPPWLLSQVLGPTLRGGHRAVVLAEEWHTVHAVLHLDWLLRQQGLRERVAILWNANNTFGFERIPWRELAAAAQITTVSRYMRHLMEGLGVASVVIPNGLGAESFEDPDAAAVSALQDRLRDRLVLTKIARWDRDKAWTSTLDIVELLRRREQRPLLVARGGLEAYGFEVLRHAQSRGLRVADRWLAAQEPEAMVAAMADVDEVDVVNLRSSVAPSTRSVLFCGSDVVMANSAHEPFGLVGLEAMAVGSLVCTGATGEDYAIGGRNAIVVQTSSALEFVRKFERLARDPKTCSHVRAEGRATARCFDWHSIVDRNLLPQVEVALAGG